MMAQDNVTIGHKPCPFCGNIPYWEEMPIETKTIQFLACKCGCEGPFAATMPEALEKWNRRIA